MKKLKTVYFIVVCMFVFCGVASAQNNQKLEGPQNVLNSEYRHDFYAKKSNELEKDFEGKPELENSDKIVGHFDIMVDRMLGVDFSSYKKDFVLQTQRETLNQKEIIANEHLSGAISFEQYVEQVSDVLEKSLEESSEILTDGEFVALFQFKKTEIKGIFYKLINQGLPENERVTDFRE